LSVKITILGEPASKANQRKLVTFGRGEKARPALIKSDKARDYEKTAIMQIPHGARLMLEGPLRVTIHVHYASERPDLDESVILDVLQAKFAPARDGPRQLVRAGVYANDRQVREKHVYHHIDRANPRAEIEVEQLQAVPLLFDDLAIPVAKVPRRSSPPQRTPPPPVPPGENPF
jgi:Holliday junction resolvase RusA-like endonuclease